MEFLRKVDFDRLAATSERVSQTLIGPDSGASSCSVKCIKTPPGDGSPAGLHKHMVDQLFYVLSGTMSLEIEVSAMRPVLELLWYSQPALHIAIGTAAAKRPCIWPSIHPCRTPPYPLRSRSTELRSEFAGRDPRELGRRPAR